MRLSGSPARRGVVPTAPLVGSGSFLPGCPQPPQTHLRPGTSGCSVEALVPLSSTCRLDPSRPQYGTNSDQAQPLDTNWTDLSSLDGNPQMRTTFPVPDPSRQREFQTLGWRGILKGFLSSPSGPSSTTTAVIQVWSYLDNQGAYTHQQLLAPHPGRAAHYLKGSCWSQQL